MKKKLLIVATIVALILTLDQIIKIYVKTHFTPYEIEPILGDWFVMEYIENQGMAFGTTFGSAMWHKLALSLFRIVAITLICIYWFRQAKKGARMEFLVAVGLILAGATGNLIDSMFYDFAFAFDPCIHFNYLEGSGIEHDCGLWGVQEVRHTGFLLGNVVDMFKFDVNWPQWMPWVGGDQVFPAIWNLADASITVGVIMVFFRQRKYFPKKKDVTPVVSEETQEVPVTNVSDQSTTDSVE